MNRLFFCLVCGISFWTTACREGGSDIAMESYKEGRIYITVDESYKPVVEQAILIYQGYYPKAHIIPSYKTYADCLRDFYNDSVRLVLLPKMPTAEEEKMMKERLQFKPSYGKLLIDAIAVILHRDVKDSLFDVSDLQNILDGENTQYNVAFDGDELSSTLHYCMDSILKGKPLYSRIKGAKSSSELVDYISKTPNAIGFIGISWIGDRNDTMQTGFLKKIKVASLQSRIKGEEDKYIKPYQANIALLRYPLTRSLWYVLKENYSGLGRGFVNFLTNERGQLLFKKSYLVPAKMNFTIRKVRISEKK